ncbi:MAG: UDP-N-acetylmuramate dehydrogenase [Prevotellaceae bacterium]|jgi:UDP-N-acetylmuramate dehydrogenase|nr:UDP-N-acetylmuramate dehydrogenase [Prevotellaceae bacterium]
MSQFAKNFSLKHLNTFGFDVYARYFAQPKSLEELLQIVNNEIFNNNERLVMGGGSNLLFTKDFEGCLVQPLIAGIEKTAETSEHVFVRAGAGVEWDSLVEHCVANEYYGLENLSLIPGNVGASPVQNIGAYGVEAKDSIYSVEFLNLENKTLETYGNAQCEFGYRDSIFKRAMKGKVIITHVTYQLSKTASFNTCYGNINEELKNFTEVNLRNLRQAVTNIRQSKLPDPKEAGNAGSFFKNPVVATAKADELQAQHPTMPRYNSNEGSKIPAGWLVEQCGFKGIRRGNVGVHPKQALVLVNYGGGTGEQVLQLTHEIIATVKNKFGIELEMEVNVV